MEGLLETDARPEDDPIDNVDRSGDAAAIMSSLLLLSLAGCFFSEEQQDGFAAGDGWGWKGER